MHPELTRTTAIDYITQLETTHKSMRNELVDLRARDGERQAQLEKLSQQVALFQQERSRPPYEAGPAPAFNGHFPQPPSDPPRKLPPLVNGTGPSAMQGVQYSEERR